MITLLVGGSYSINDDDTVVSKEGTMIIVNNRNDDDDKKTKYQSGGDDDNDEGMPSMGTMMKNKEERFDAGGGIPVNDRLLLMMSEKTV